MAIIMITQPAVSQNLAQVCLFVERTRPKTGCFPFILNPIHKQIIPTIIAKINIGIEIIILSLPFCNILIIRLYRKKQSRIDKL